MRSDQNPSEAKDCLPSHPRHARPARCQSRLAGLSAKPTDPKWIHTSDCMFFFGKMVGQGKRRGGLVILSVEVPSAGQIEAESPTRQAMRPSFRLSRHCFRSLHHLPLPLLSLLRDRVHRRVLPQYARSMMYRLVRGSGTVFLVIHVRLRGTTRILACVQKSINYLCLRPMNLRVRNCLQRSRTEAKLTLVGTQRPANCVSAYLEI